MLQGPSHFLVSSVQFLVPSSCVLGVASEMSNLFTSSYSFLVVTIWCTSWVLPRSAPFICQISLLYSSDPQKSTIPAPHCRCLSVTLSREPLKLYSSFVFRFPLLSSHFVLTLTFLDCFVFLSMIFDQSGLNFFFDNMLSIFAWMVFL